jgi:hypothetical protein
VNDQRSFTRIRFSGSASLDLPDGTTLVGEVVDLSVRGAWVRTAARVPEGTSGAFKLVLGEGEGAVVYGSATVVRVGLDGLGWVFDAVDLDGYHFLTNLVTYNASDRVEQVQGEIRAHLGLKRR